MLRSTWTTGRRGALLGASAAVVCATLTACGNTGDGYVAVGPPHPSATAARPTGSVTLVPLDGDVTPKSPTASGTSSPGTKPAPTSTPGPSSPPESSSPPAAKSGGSKASSPPSTPTPAPTTAPRTPAPSTPAALTWATPTRKATDKRWCEDVTLAFHNSGGTAVRSGTVTLGTHIIGSLGIDWATIRTTEQLPTPITANTRENGTWTVCVDAWRVPLGMHIETRDVSVTWQ
ncbi:hypothetical protein OG601_17840 [Streptomyces sp. NBC_01239]|uniref:hypothetical protein n=1 Tax=Streptomyces sp. NBC_01239 TaxID=2903792 RepID=UPI0022598882|nr:hypothetical protein [Streptomyces sp. NBC_01239]MCX4812469.1 hypothetical protein [Streptomyces sp. NBC_01239]